MLLCKSKNDLVAEYSLKDMSKPIGVSAYQITSSLPEELERQLPSVEDIQKRIKGVNQNISHRNHYIPQFYLKNWSSDGRTIQTYSILVSNENVPYWTKQSIKNTAVWNDFYTRVVGVEELDDFEHWFDREFESPAKPIFDKLISGAKLSREEHKALSRFVFAQYLRTPAAYLRLTKQNSKIFPNVMDTVLEKLNHASKREFQRSRPCQSAISKEDVLFPLKISLDRENSMVEVKTVIGKGFYLHDLKHLLTSTVRVSERLNWQVLHASDDVSFPTSDDPVICLNYNNERDYDFDGGWGIKHGNILMPISPKLLLFSEIGEKGSYPDLDYSPMYSKLFREMIIRHAHRYVYAEHPQKGMLALNARVVNRDWYEAEKHDMAGWHIENIKAEANL